LGFKVGPSGKPEAIHIVGEVQSPGPSAPYKQGKPKKNGRALITTN